MKKVFLAGLVFAAVVIAGKIWYIAALGKTGAPQTSFPVTENESTDQIAKQLHEKKLIKSKTAFKLHVRLNGLAKDFKVGRHRLSGEQSATVIAKALTAQTRADSLYTVTEGLTQREIATQLEEQDITNAKDFADLNAADFSHHPFLKDVPDSASLEGFLFPDTYDAPVVREPAKDVAEVMLANFEKKVVGSVKDDLSRSGRSLYEIVIVASMLEEEVRTDKDRRIVAGILYRRLREDIRLDVDATTRYAVNKKSREPLTGEDLDSSNPYNTRRVKGLPPGPISNPGLASIEAALNPEESEFLFYLSDRDGVTRFAKTLDEHNANVEKYLR